MTTQAQKQISSTRRITGIVIALLLITALLEIAVGNVRAFQVVSRSMEPTLEVGDCVLSVRELAGDHLRGKVVAFDPKEPGDALVKRVVADNGEVVEVRGQLLYVAGRKDCYSDDPIERIDAARWNLNQNRLFVVGDNRNNSFDSIDHGPIERQQVLGVVAFRYWPPSRIGPVD